MEAQDQSRTCLLSSGRVNKSVENVDKTDMSKHFPALCAELRRTFGENGPLPKLSTLQQMERNDLEQVRLVQLQSLSSDADLKLTH